MLKSKYILACVYSNNFKETKKFFESVDNPEYYVNGIYKIDQFYIRSDDVKPNESISFSSMNQLMKRDFLIKNSIFIENDENYTKDKQAWTHFNLLSIATLRENKEIIDLLMSISLPIVPKTELYDMDPICIAIRYHDYSLISHLLSFLKKDEILKGYLTNLKVNESKTVLLDAIERNQSKTIDLLCKYGADIHQEYETTVPISCAFVLFEKPDDLLLETIRKYHTDPINKQHSNGDTVLMFAIKNFSYKRFKSLLRMGANPNLVNTFNCYPLWLAVYYQRVNIFYELLPLTYNLDLKSNGLHMNETKPLFNKELSPLQVAFDHQNYGLVRALKIAGASFNELIKSLRYKNDLSDTQKDMFDFLNRPLSLLQASALSLRKNNFILEQIYNQLPLNVRENLVRFSSRFEIQFHTKIK